MHCVTSALCNTCAHFANRQPLTVAAFSWEQCLPASAHIVQVHHHRRHPLGCLGTVLGVVMGVKVRVVPLTRLVPDDVKLLQLRRQAGTGRGSRAGHVTPPGHTTQPSSH